MDRETGGPSAPAERVRPSYSQLQRDADLSGRTLGDFVVAEKIGEGGFGSVYRAHQPLLDRPAVIKVLHTRLRATAAATERFLREARLASRLDHPYAAHIYAFGAENDGTLWIAMELVRGTTLSEYLRVHGPLSVERFVLLLERICEVVHSAHEQGIIHRDLKPANVMVVARAGRLLPKLLDFGIAKSLLDATAAEDVVDEPAPLPARLVRARSDPAIAMDVTITPSEAASLPPETFESVPPEPETVVGPRSKNTGPRSVELSANLTQQGTVMGSPHYMAPEQWSDAAAVTARTDLYALGILAYEALTGAPPFRGSSVSALASAHANESAPPLPRGFPPALDGALAKALAKQPADRYDNALELAAALRAAAGLADEKRPLPQLDEAVRQQYVADAPQSIAEAVAALESARDPRQARDALWVIPTILGRWLAVVALLARSRLGPSRDSPGTLAAVRELGTTLPDDDAWIEAAYTLLRGYADQPDLHPLPELVLFACAPDGSPGEGLALYRDLVARRPGIADTTANEDEIIDRLRPALVQLSSLLRKAAFVCSYTLVAPAGDGFGDRWSGTRRPQRVQVVARGKVQENVPVIVDQEGHPVITLHPLVQIAEPAPGVSTELFVFAGRDARGIKLTAPPTAFERHDPAVLDWLRVQMASTLDLSHGAAAAERAPYRGLAAFTADDAALFVGREAQVDAFVNRLRMQPLVAVVGPSGAGKSSFVQAGVIPALGESWRSIILRPGPAPLVSLASRVNAAGVRANDLATRLRDDPMRLGDLLRDDAAAHGPILLVIDQLEELFTLVHDVAERQAFALAIVSAARAVDDPVRVIATLRDDFLAVTQSLTSLRDRFAQGLQLLTTPNREDLERILVEPARRLGYEFEDPKLPARMVVEVADRPGALALLSFTAAQLWEQRDRHFRRLPTKAYEALGGVGGALARHAESVLEGAPAAEQRLIREAFRHLVTAEGTRAVLTRRELVSVMGGSAAAESAVEHLVASRLLVAREGEEEEQIEIAHEALISAWPRLVAWRHDDLEGARMRDQLRASARQWDARGRPNALLWRDDVLADLERWRARQSPSLTDQEAAFANASARESRRGRRIRRALIVAVPVVLLSAYVLVEYSNRAKLRSRAMEHVAAAEQLLATSRTSTGKNIELRRVAFAKFDRGEWEQAETQWQAAQAAAAERDRGLSRASQLLEAALKIDVHNDRVSSLLGDVLLERAFAAELDHRGSLEELVERLALYDASGARRQQLAAPARLKITVDPPAAITIERFAINARGPWQRVDSRVLSDRDPVLAPGSYLLTLSAPGRATVRLPIVLSRHEDVAVDVELPASVPAGFVYVPRGRFLVGSKDEGLRTGFLGTVPLHEMVNGPFLIARHETTYADWIEYLDTLSPEERERRAPRVGKGLNNAMELVQTGGTWQLKIQPSERSYSAMRGEPIRYGKRDRRVDQDWSKFPVGGVSCQDAEAYAAWLNSSGRVPGARLCNELEWERAARGADDREYPHGDVLAPDDANYDATYNKEPDGFGPDEVGAHPASESPFGTFDQSGNVWEWTKSGFSGAECVARGGGYYMTSKSARVTNREVTEPTARDAQLGVRICADVK